MDADCVYYVTKGHRIIRYKLDKFPFAVVISDHKPGGFKTTQMNYLLVLKVRNIKWFLMGSSQGVSTGLHSFWRLSMENAIFCLFQLLQVICSHWPQTPSSIFKGSSAAPSNVSLT